MAAWKLASLLLVTCGFSGLATMVIFALSRPLPLSYQAYQRGGAGVMFDPGLVVATCMALAAGYAGRMARSFYRWSRGRATVQ